MVHIWQKLFLLFFISINILNAELIISNPKQEKHLDESVVFDCMHEKAFESSIVWIKKGILEDRSDDVIISVRKSLLIDDRRFDVRNSLSNLDDAVEQSVRLEIHSLNALDSGIYICQVLSETDNSTAEATLTVTEPAHFRNQNKQNVFASVGESIELECLPEGYPKPNITWHFGSNMIHEGNKLLLKSINESDRGQYICTAKNEFASKRLVIDLYIEVAPFVTSPKLIHRPTVNAKEVKLLCHIEGLPLPEVAWMKDGKRLYEGKKYKMQSRYTSNTIMDVVLLIYKANKSDLGEYTCEASNKLGKGQVTINVVKPENEKIEEGKSFCKTLVASFDERNDLVGPMKECY